MAKKTNYSNLYKIATSFGGAVVGCLGIVSLFLIVNSNVKEGFISVKENMTDIRTDIADVKKEVSSLNLRIDKIESDIKDLGIGLSFSLGKNYKSVADQLKIILNSGFGNLDEKLKKINDPKTLEEETKELVIENQTDELQQ